VWLLRYPGVGNITPFAAWCDDPSTESICWYDFYQKVKHNREDCFDQGTLLNVMNAVAACLIMLAAQYGTNVLSRYQMKNIFGFAMIHDWHPKYLTYRPPPPVPWTPQMANI
jgi:hypothetical protein